MKTITLNFIGKSSVPFHRTIEVSDALYEVIKRSQDGKKPGDEIFDLASSGDVNDLLKQVDKSFTPKVMRTARCNTILIENLKRQKVNEDSTELEKIEAIYKANFAIAKELNHQKNIGKNQKKNQQVAEEKVRIAEDKLKSLKKEVKQKLKELSSKEEDFKVKYAAMPTMLKEKLEKIEADRAKLEKCIKDQKDRVSKAKFQADKTTETADIALGTSLANYADPRIVYSWCKDVDLDISKVYNKNLQEKFSWAATTPADYWRKL